MSRGARTLSWVLVTLALVCLTRGARAGDPYIEWYTLETPHFRVHFHSGLGSVARRTADLAEDIHRRLAPHLGWAPSEITHLTLADDSDSANGSATSLPYNQIRLFVTAPDDMSPLGDYDDWTLELLTHEYTHVLHVDNTSGIPALVNALIGKTYSPNQAQPRWILEGLAVAMESEHSSGGRLRSTQFDMFLRADVLSGRLARLDQISNPPRRWPSGNLWYLYGGKFIAWIHDVYGPDVFAAVATDYGSNIIPWGINRSIRRVTGRTYVELYEGWKAHLRERYGRQVAEVRRRGLREGRRLTFHGRAAFSPRVVPPRCAPDSRLHLVYYREDGHEAPGLYRLPIEPDGRAGEAELLTRSSGRISSFDVDCSLVFETVAPSRRRYYFSGLFRLPPGGSPRGFRRTTERLTTGRRAREPDVSPDGRRVAYVTNSRGTSTLRVAELGQDAITAERRLVPSAEYEQAYTPRWSPDGTKIAYSTWTSGGNRDLRIVDVTSGRFYALMHDRAIDQQPAWSPDGSVLYFVSDRTGIANVYAHELATGRVAQVTNVRTGAYMPEVSPDGRTLFYVGYTSDGFDVFALELEPSRFLAAEAVPSARPSAPPTPERGNWRVSHYQPLSTLRPRAFEIEYGPGTFGDTITLTMSGSDAVGLHGVAVGLSTAWDRPEPQLSLDYAYRRLPFDFRATVFQSAAPRTFTYGETPYPVVERLIGATTGVSFTSLGILDAQSVSLSYTLASYDTDQPLSSSVDPYSTVTGQPDEGTLGLVRLGFGYGNAEAYEYSISAERGFTLAAGLDHGSEPTGSDATLTAINGRLTGYFSMPWLQHHVLALGLSGGTSTGSYARRGLFFTGGFLEADLVDAFSSGVRQGAFVLRGYEPGQFAGSQFNLLNVEYRFPLLYADRGVATLPVFLRTLSGTLFADYGGAFERLDPEHPLRQYHLGLGAELWVDLVLGYFARGTIRVGVARGTSSEAPGTQTYVVASSGF